jgi:hypothetical protein
MVFLLPLDLLSKLFHPGISDRDPSRTYLLNLFILLFGTEKKIIYVEDWYPLFYQLTCSGE